MDIKLLYLKRLLLLLRRKHKGLATAPTVPRAVFIKFDSLIAALTAFRPLAAVNWYFRCYRCGMLVC